MIELAPPAIAGLFAKCQDGHEDCERLPWFEGCYECPAGCVLEQYPLASQLKEVDATDNSSSSPHAHRISLNHVRPPLITLMQLLHVVFHEHPLASEHGLVSHILLIRSTVMGSLQRSRRTLTVHDISDASALPLREPAGSSRPAAPGCDRLVRFSLEREE